MAKTLRKRRKGPGIRGVHLKKARARAEGFERQDFFVHLELLAKILGDFEESEQLEDQRAKVILETYNFLKSKLEVRFFQVYEDYQAKMEQYRKKSTERQNVECPECGSNQLVSRGAEWQCKKCYRRFTKRRRSLTNQ